MVPLLCTPWEVEVQLHTVMKHQAADCPICSRSRASRPAISLDTCIWVTPTSLPISAWVHPAEEPHLENQALPRVEGADQRLQRGPGLGAGETGVLGAEPEADTAVAAVVGEVQRGGREAAVGGQGVDDQVELHVEVSGDLGRTWGPPQLLAQLGLGGGDPAPAAPGSTAAGGPPSRSPGSSAEAHPGSWALRS